MPLIGDLPREPIFHPEPCLIIKTHHNDDDDYNLFFLSPLPPHARALLSVFSSFLLLPPVLLLLLLFYLSNNKLFACVSVNINDEKRRNACYFSFDVSTPRARDEAVFQKNVSVWAVLLSRLPCLIGRPGLGISVC